jgi:23S rRNA pseudouridine1911/1915/1917 synthase
MKYTARQTATLLEVVMEMNRGISKQGAKKFIGTSSIMVDGKAVKNHPMLMVEQGQVLDFIKVVKVERNVTPPTRSNPISIHFEDEYLIVAQKTAGVLSCKDKNQVSATSTHTILEQFIADRDGKKLRLWPVHRLDREVEGLIIFAKSEDFQTTMKDVWSTVTKKYLALVEGTPETAKGVIESWLKDDENQRVRVYNTNVEGSKFAKTEFQILERVKQYTLLEITLHTGRKNQIRAHLSAIGCPIVGDRKYGAEGTVRRQIRLAAYKIEFKHPISEKMLKLEYKPSLSFFNPSTNEDENYRIV